MKVVSLFSGAGGLDLGFIMAGHTIVWANDLFEDAVSTYEMYQIVTSLLVVFLAKVFLLRTQKETRRMKETVSTRN